MTDADATGAIDVVALYREAAREIAGADLATLSLDTRIADLALDSVMVLEIVGWLEQRLGVQLEDDELGKVETVRDLANLLEAARARAA